MPSRLFARDLLLPPGIPPSAPIIAPKIVPLVRALGREGLMRPYKRTRLWVAHPATTVWQGPANPHSTRTASNFSIVSPLGLTWHLYSPRPVPVPGWRIAVNPCRPQGSPQTLDESRGRECFSTLHAKFCCVSNTTGGLPLRVPAAYPTSTKYRLGSRSFSHRSPRRVEPIAGFSTPSSPLKSLLLLLNPFSTLADHSTLAFPDNFSPSP